MKWRGRRQSTNVIDLTDVKQIVVSWNLFGSSENINHQIMQIDSDGTIYGTLKDDKIQYVELLTSDQRPYRVSIEDWVPRVTDGQRLSLIRTINTISAIYTDNIAVVSKSSDQRDILLTELVYTLLNRK